MSEEFKIGTYDMTLQDSDYPEIIQKQFDELSELETQVNKASDKAHSAQKSAEKANRSSAKVGHHKETIEALQEATVELADSQMSTSKALAISFEYQKKLADVSKYLMGLGMSSIVANRRIIEELELRLSGASGHKISELAKQEMMNLISQLKASQDIFEKTEKTQAKVEEIDEKQRRAEQETEENRKSQKKTEEKQDKAIEEHNDSLRQISGKVQNHTRQIKELQKSSREYKKSINDINISITTISKKVKNLEGEKSNLQRTIDDIEKKQKDQIDRIDNLESYSAIQDEETKRIEDKVDDVKMKEITTIKNQIKSIEDKIDKLNNHISHLNTDSEENNKLIKDIQEKTLSATAVIGCYVISAIAIIISILSLVL